MKTGMSVQRLGAMATLVLGGLTASAMADLMESQVQNFSFPLSPGDVTLSFNQFDDQGGMRVLTEVTFLINGEIQASVTAENNSVLPAPDFALQLSGNLTGTFGDLSVAGLYNETFNTDGNVTASDGVEGSGPDFWDFGTVSDSESQGESTTSDLAQYVGAGTIDAEIAASGGFTISGSTDSRLVIRDFGASGTAEVIYTYNMIPGPASLAMLGVAGLAGGGRRRRRG